METLIADEIIEEIHAIRREHAASFDFDIARIINDLKKSEQIRTNQGWPLASTREIPMPNTSFCRMRRDKAAKQA
ncbi:MAG: hypothetical protein WC091_05735 [Sulfuricellaceae bacterium]